MTTTNPTPKKSGSNAVIRTLDIMEFLAQHHRYYGATELSRILNIPKNTVFRILRSLAERDYAVQDRHTGHFQLSTRVFVLGMKLSMRFELRKRARPHLELLCEETQQTCQLQIPYGDRALVLDTVTPEMQAYYHASPGGLNYYHPNAFGKAILAFMTKQRIKEILPQRMVRLTENTIVDRSELLSQLEEIRKSGIAYDNEEYTKGVFCIGAPVFNVEGAIVAGLGVTGLLSWIDTKGRVQLEVSVLKCAYNTSKDMGYTGKFFSCKAIN